MIDPTRIPEHAWHHGQPFWPEHVPPSVAAQACERPILETIAAVAARHPAHVAAEDPDRTLRFDQLMPLVRTIAASIAASPVRAGPIAVLAHADATTLPAVLACIALGRPAVLLDPTVPPARTADLIARTGATLALVAASAAATLPPDLVRIPVAITPGEAPPELPPAHDLHAPAIILCTSGSTGRPKTIVHSQRTVLQRAYYHANGAGVRPGDLCLSLTPPTTLGGMNGMFAFALAGGGTRFFDLREHGIAGLLAALRDRPITSLRAVPSVLRLLAVLPEAPPALAALHNVTTLGEPILRADIVALRAILGPTTTIFNMYGATESGSIAGYPDADAGSDPVRAPTGWLVPGSDAAILDDEGHACTPGTPGELVIRSRYNALGEWQDGACVPGAQIADPADPTRRIHRTGDLVTRDAQGLFVVLGRRDRMLKVNGQRIEPSEIEAAIRQHPEILECAVVARPTGASLGITAFVTLRPDARPGALDTIRAAIRLALPAAMVPSRLIAIDALPLLPGGKVDLMALVRTGRP